MNETLLFLVDATQVDDFTEYTIDVHHGGNIWKVKHRYSEFKALHDSLRLKYPNIEKNLLPPKKLFGKMSPSFVDKRKKELEIYLQALINKTYPSGLPLVLRRFLHFHRYEVEMLCQYLAEKLYKVGDRILMSGSSYTFNTLELWAITERISLQKPHTDAENPNYDFGHVLDFIQKLKYLHLIKQPDELPNTGLECFALIRQQIVCHRGYVGSSNIISEELVFDPSLFRSLTQVVADGCNEQQAQSIAKLRRQLSSLSVHQSMSSIESLLSGGYDQMGLSESWNQLITADFSDNHITVIDDSVKLMPRVEFLDLSRNSISKIENLQYLTGLTFVDLSHNVIDEFECAHARLGNVKTLILAHNKLKSLRGLGKLYALEALDVSHNSISELKEIDHVANLPCISKLNVSSNTVTTVLDYRTQTLSKFASRACEICLDETPSTQKELDTAAVLHAIFKSRKLSESSSKSRKDSSPNGKLISSPIEIKQKKTYKSLVLSAPGRFCLTPDELDRARRENKHVTESDSVAHSSDVESFNFSPRSGDLRKNTSFDFAITNQRESNTPEREKTPLPKLNQIQSQNDAEYDANVFLEEKHESKRLSRVSEIDESISSPVKTAKKPLEFNPDPFVLSDDNEDYTSSSDCDDGDDDDSYETSSDRDFVADDASEKKNISAIEELDVVNANIDYLLPDSLDHEVREVEGLLEELLVVIERNSNLDAAGIKPALNTDSQEKVATRNESTKPEENRDPATKHRNNTTNFNEEKSPCSGIISNNFSADKRSRKQSNTLPLDDSNDNSFSVTTLDDDWGESAWSCSLVVKCSDNETEQSPFHDGSLQGESYPVPRNPGSKPVLNGGIEEQLNWTRLVVEPNMNLKFHSTPLRHLAMSSPPLLRECRLRDMGNDERLLYVTWSRVIFYEEPTNEISCAVFVTNQALYFVADSLRNSLDCPRDMYDVSELDNLKDTAQLLQRRFPFCGDDSTLFHLVVGLFSQSVRVVGSNPSQTATLVTRSSHLTNNFVMNLTSACSAAKSETEDVRRLLDQSWSLQDTQLKLSNVVVSLANQQAMMDFNLTTVEMWSKETKDRSDCVPQLLLYLLIRLLSPPDEKPKTFVLTSEFCCLCNENLVSYPIPDFEFDSPPDQRYSDFEIVYLTDLRGLRLSNPVSYDLTILLSQSSSQMQEWRLSFRDYVERDQLLHFLCEQYYEVSGKVLNIHCAADWL